MSWKNSFFAKSMFIRLMASFLLVILIVSVLFAVSFGLYIDNMQQQVIGNTKERFDLSCNKFDYEFTKVTDTLYRLSTDDYFKPVVSGKPLTYFEIMQIRNLMYRLVSMNYSIRNLYLLTDNSDYVISNQGTFDKADFFGKFFSSSKYGLDFWDGEKDKKFYYSFYDPGEFTDKTDSDYDAKTLLPIAFKDNYKSNYILVALVDVRNFTSNIESGFLKNFVVLNGDNSLIFSADMNPDGETVKFAQSGSLKSKNGYLLKQNSLHDTVQYYRYLPNTELRETLLQSSTAIFATLLLAIILSVLLSYFIARGTNDQAKKIVEIMGGAIQSAGAGGESTDLLHIRNGIQRIVAQNSQYSDDLKARDLILEDFFYRTKIKDIHVPLNAYGHSYTIKDNYVLACFTLHYRQDYFEQSRSEQNKGTIRIKELIHQGIGACVGNCITFQSENNQIVSIINVDTASSGVAWLDAFSEIAQAVRSQEPFVFFTVAVSSVKNDLIELDTVYRNMVSLCKYRVLAEKNQVLSEGSGQREGKFYFSLAQAERFSDYLSNGRMEECLQQIDDILETNHRNNVDNFYFTLLCTEIVNCAAKTLASLNKGVPAELNVNGVYEQLQQSWTLEHFKRICKGFVITVGQKLRTFEKNKEYIVDYIKEFVEKHYSEDIYLELFADKLHLSKAYISLNFKNKTGVNFSDWLNDYRMKKAVEMLNGTTLKVQEIGRLIGYNTNTFIRSFKKYSGQTPSEYRQARLLSK